MLRRLILCSLFAASTVTTGAVAKAENNATAAPAEQDGMTVLFDGKSLDGWDGDPTLWEVRDGVIHGETTKEKVAKGNTFLIWKDELADFELRLSFRCTASNNSGIQYRSQRVDTKKSSPNQWVLRGYQHEIRNEEDFPNVPSFIYDEKGSRGRICLVGEKAVWNKDGKEVIGEPLISKEEFKELMKVDEWNDVVIIAEGNRIRHYLNGRLVLDFTDNHPEKSFSKGFLGLQLHAGKPMWAEFKNIRLRTL
ncbi:DUF1080 domain-containing protein [Roseiconus lacunae]|uniref:DUF1080 domain-containing protein n=1 Tax=Roseiconus lacunae TaxID=2605694 RepID=A0ABT7PN86_9BACT|nr:DUF1080 domain-containing protein [Roseiconus lacunae]MCD0462071.1 DUF1080 domain-containing protein [Roseiconus lacunae]MDM4017982.1 DUF1080 domain-containing protein [Roseiconus lacunae]WRQ52445.1 DUF1080 domain-containing protein [Stieleria sp. HD01]